MRCRHCSRELVLTDQLGWTHRYPRGSFRTDKNGCPWPLKIPDHRPPRWTTQPDEPGIWLAHAAGELLAFSVADIEHLGPDQDLVHPETQRPSWFGPIPSPPDMKPPQRSDCGGAQRDSL